MRSVFARGAINEIPKVYFRDVVEAFGTNWHLAPLGATFS